MRELNQINCIRYGQIPSAKKVGVFPSLLLMAWLAMHFTLVNAFGIVKSNQDSLSEEFGLPSSEPQKAKPQSLSKNPLSSRLEYIKSNPQLDRRIQSFIRKGQIGMGMNTEEVKAALGNPDSETHLLLLEKTKQKAWIYVFSPPLIVIFEKGKVSGWSMDK